MTTIGQEREMNTEGVLPRTVDDPLLTSAEAAEVLGVSRWWFGELVRRGLVGPCARISRRLRVRRSVLDRYRAERAGDPEDPYLTYEDIGAYLGVSSWTAGGAGAAWAANRNSDRAAGCGAAVGGGRLRPSLHAVISAPGAGAPSLVVWSCQIGRTIIIRFVLQSRSGL
ncbi:helix-turn-helix domain-containing protein [Promicromonospora soli]